MTRETTLRQGLYDLLSSVQIDTKEHGRVHVEPWLSQRLVVDGIAKGLAEDCHEFCILKCRQVAITTVSEVIMLFWALANEGMQGAAIADRTDNLERLRRIFAALLETLPPQWRGPNHRLVANNRTGLAFANHSVIDLLAAANNPDLGASRALNMIHATECGQWRSLAGVESLKAALARQNPNRLYIWESIANGYNWWYQFCQQAKTDRHMRFIFIGFWANPTYSIAKSDQDFPIYMEQNRKGEYRFTDEELKKARYVKQTYGVTVLPEQVAWWRREAERSAPEYMDRHYPWTERECFIASGSGWFPAKRTLEISEALATGAPYKGYKYTFEEEFLSSTIVQTTKKDEVTLRVWEPPAENGVYAIGVDPSGGGGEAANDHAIQVLRCYADRAVQVAEYQSNQPLTYQLAWVLAHLCGAYKNHLANLEVTGVGAAVMPEVRRLRQLAERGILQADPAKGNILDMIGSVRWFLYKRPDSLGGAGNIQNWKTNADNKAQIYSELRDGLMQRIVEIRSPRLMQQMQAIVEDQGWIGAGPDTGENDDLVSAFVLAYHTWVEWRRPGLIAQNHTWDSVHTPPTKGDPGTMLSFAFSQYMKKVHQKNSSRPREKF
jgi:hypothetical protein